MFGEDGMPQKLHVSTDDVTSSAISVQAQCYKELASYICIIFLIKPSLHHLHLSISYASSLPQNHSYVQMVIIVTYKINLTVHII